MRDGMAFADLICVRENVDEQSLEVARRSHRHEGSDAICTWGIRHTSRQAQKITIIQRGGVQYSH
jgi:hypothetical protein